MHLIPSLPMAIKYSLQRATENKASTVSVAAAPGSSVVASTLKLQPLSSQVSRSSETGTGRIRVILATCYPDWFSGDLRLERTDFERFTHAQAVQISVRLLYCSLRQFLLA